MSQSSKTVPQVENQSKQQLQYSINRLRTLREEFRQWYGSLSVKELSSNRILIQEIEKLERLFSLQALEAR